jgi:hypothetical protein
MRNAFILCIVIVALSACHMLPNPPKPRLSLNENSIPPTGIYDVSQVVIDDRGHNIFEFGAAATKAYPEDQLFATMWCRANLFAKEKGYTGWYKLRQETKKQGDAYMFKKTRPDGKSGLLTDWCAICQARTPPALENTKPALEIPRPMLEYPTGSPR